MNIYLVRHTTPKVEREVLYGATDLPLVDTFLEEAAAVKRNLPDLSGMRVYSSPLSRSHKLAEYLCTDEHEIQVDQRLKEMNFGAWENKPFSEIPADAFKHWRSNFITEAPPEGETFLKFYERVTDFWDELLQEDEQDTLVVSHSGVMHALVAHVLEIPLENVYHLKMGYGQIVHLSPRAWGGHNVELIAPR